jgi:hypothetical protein
MAQADAVLATTGTSRTFPVAEMAAALAATGWESPSGDPAAGLPSPGVMVALQGVWREVTR